jgi:putative ABC transport system ATP-binding protein
MIQLKKLNVKFNMGTALEKWALRNVSLDIFEGEFVTVIGGNGAGKSTLLATLCGDVSPLSGRVIIDNVDVTTRASWQRAKWVARVFQDPMAGTCAHLSIEENLALASKRVSGRGFSPAIAKHDRERFREALSKLGLNLDKRLKDPMGALSGGQRQAVSLIMSTLQPMKILALDEHTAALDPKTAHYVIDLTRQIIADNNLTALMVTHSMQQALNYGTRTVMLNEGRIVYDVSGQKRDNLTTQDLVDLFHSQQLNHDDFLLS